MTGEQFPTAMHIVTVLCMLGLVAVRLTSGS